jgi:hypothetical protein
VRDALSKGAKAATGGGRPKWDAGSPFEKGFFFEPTVLVGEHGMLLLPALFGKHTQGVDEGCYSHEGNARSAVRVRSNACRHGPGGRAA